MAFIRLEPQEGVVAGKRQYDGICELLTDLSAEVSNGYAAFNGSHVQVGQGSLIHCMEDGNLYAKGSNDAWAATTPEEDA